MKKILTLSLFAFLTILPAQSFSATCASEDGGPALNGSCSVEPNKFEQTINSLRLIRLNGDGTTTFVEIAATPQSYDFASVGAGAALGDYIAGAAIPVGTYVGMSPVLDKMATVNASTTVDGMDCRTDTAGFSTDGGAPLDYTYDFTAGSPFTSGTDAAYDYDTASDTEEWLNGDGDVFIAKKFTPITITADSSTSVSIELSVDAAEAADFRFDGSVCEDASLGELGVTITTTSM